MAVATEKIIPGVLPPKEETPDIDFLVIYDNFDASALTDEQLLKFAPRNPFVTAYPHEERYYEYEGLTYPIPDSPIKERLHHGQFCVKRYRKDIIKANNYKNRRLALNQAIGIKACTEYVQRQYDQMSEKELAEDQENWDRWCRYCDEKRNNPFFEKDPDEMTEEELDELIYGPIIPDGYTVDYDWKHHQDYIPIMSLKFQMVRKNVGLTQRDFAKRIGYNVNKYALLENGKLEKLGLSTLDEAFPLDLVKRVVDATYANPYWLEDQKEYSLDVDMDRTAMTVEEAVDTWDRYAMFADAKVIRYWWSHIYC